MNLDIENVNISDASKVLLRKLIAAGYSKSGADYVVGPEIASANEFREIMNESYKGGVPLLSKCQILNVGSDSGKVSFQFAFNLSCVENQSIAHYTN